MASYALSQGLNVPAETLAGVDVERDSASLAQLIDTHSKLVQVVAPARPATIEALYAGVDPGGTGPNRAPIIGQLSRVLAVAVPSVVVLGVVHAALGFGSGYDPESGDINSLKHFVVANGLFVGLATLGASFQALMTAQRSLERMSLEPRDAPVIWSRVWLGIAAGVLLATYLDVGSSGDGAGSLGLSRPLLALLGGFASDVVYRILDGAVKAVSAALDRNVEDVLAVQHAGSQLKLQRVTDEERRSSTQKLLAIQGALTRGDSNDDLRQLVGSMLPGSGSVPVADGRGSSPPPDATPSTDSTKEPRK